MIRGNLLQAAQAARRVALESRKLGRFLKEVHEAIDRHSLTAEQKQNAITTLATYEQGVVSAQTLYATISNATTVQPYPDGDPAAS